MTTVELSGEHIKAFVKQLSKDKGLSVDIIKEALEDAIVQASKKNLSAYTDARCTLDLESGRIDLFVKKEVVEKVKNPRTELKLSDAKKFNADAKPGDFIEVATSPDEFGRIAAQSARQHVMQRLRDAERLKLYAEFKDKVGEIFAAEVARTERREVIVKLPGGEASLPFTETNHAARLRPAERLKVVIIKVDPEARGHMVTVSRNHPQLVAKLFEQEVPEIADGIVEILGVAREPGIRSKIAVHSKNPDVDPVGACVGMKGSRVQMVVRELENERIDIVPYDPDPARFIQAALNPAKIVSVLCNEETRAADVTVAKDNLSLAIGKRGQNARLAAKLTGWKIDVRSEEENVENASALAGAEIDRRYLEDFLSQLEELTEEQRAHFGKGDLNTVAAIAECDVDRLTRTLHSPELARFVKEAAAEYVQALKEMADAQQGEPEEAPAAEEAASENPAELPTEEQPVAQEETAAE